MTDDVLFQTTFPPGARIRSSDRSLWELTGFSP